MSVQGLSLNLENTIEEVINDAAKAIVASTEELDLSSGDFSSATETVDLEATEATADMDLSNIDLSSLTPEDLQALVGNMTQEEYDQFIKGMEGYYDNQLEYLEGLLHTPDGKGFEDVLATLDQYVNLYIEGSVITKEQEKLYLDKLSEFGVTDITSAQALQSKYAAYVAKIKQGIMMTKNVRDSAKYDYMCFMTDYTNYKMDEIEDLKATLEADSKAVDYMDYVADPNSLALGPIDPNAGSKVYSYQAYHEKHPEIDPMEYVMMLPEGAVVWDIEGYETLCTLAHVYEMNPNYANIYSYLYSQDPEKAKDYLKANEYEFNNLQGQILANEFRERLRGADEATIEAALANEFGVTTEGLADGLVMFGEGVWHAGESVVTGGQKLASAVGLYDGEIYENRVMSAQEYKRMYILQLLLSKEDKIKAGILTADGKNANPNSLIDFSEEYAGAYLSNNYEISQGIGNMLPSIAVSAVNPMAGSVVLGVSAGGNAYHGAMVEGHDYISSLAYGVFTGTSEAVTERLIGGLPGLSNVQVTGLKTYLQSMGREGTQEIVQGLFDEIYQCSFMGKELPKTAEEWEAFAQNLGKQGVYGAITAGILQTPNVLTSTHSISKFNKVIEDKGITPTEQALAIEQIRNSNEQFKGLSDEAIIIQSANEIIEQANVNKLVSLGIKDEIARIMIRNETTEEVAKYMLENNVSKEQALIDMSKVPETPREDYVGKLDLSKFDSKTNRRWGINRIIDDYYIEKCNIFFDLAPSADAKYMLENILLKGEVDGFSFASDIHHKDNPSIEQDRRIAMANLYLRNPETFDYIVKNKIDLFHGTNGEALPSIIENGLCSLAESQSNGIEVTTGEKWSRFDVPRGFVSFADILDIAKYYSKMPSSTENNDLNFEVIIGTTTEAAERAGTTPVYSNVSEIGVIGKLDASDIKVIFVPSEKVEIVKELLGNKNIDVLPLDQKGELYHYHIYDHFMNIDEKRVAELKEELRERYESQFSSEVKQFAKDNNLLYEVAQLMHDNPSITLEQGQAINQIHINDPSIKIENILPSTALDVLELQELVWKESGLTLKEYGSREADDTSSEETKVQAAALAAQKRAEAEAVEKEISADMKALETNSRKLAKFDSRLKGEDSASRKIISDFIGISKNNPDFTLEDASNEIGDIIRYTMICDESSFTEDVSSCLQELQSKGYIISKFKNKFDDPMYKGINVVLISPDGIKTEVQFHTEQSFLYKDDAGHLYYEISRNENVSDEAKEISNRIRQEMASQIIIPEGALDLTLEQINEGSASEKESTAIYLPIDEIDISNLEFSHISPKALFNYQLTEADADNFYKVTVNIDGTEKVFYITPCKNVFDEYYLMINQYIDSEDYSKVREVKIEETSEPEISFDSLHKMQSFNEIFGVNEYGGDQDEVEFLVSYFIKNPTDRPLTITDRKAKLLIDLIRTAFPTATDMEVINIADKYAECGCYYMAISDAFSLYIGNQENGERIFRKKLGFDLRTTDGASSKYNLEAIALDIFLRKAEKTTGGDASKISEVGGVSINSFDEDIVEYFKEKGITLKKSGETFLESSTSYKNSILAEIASNPDKAFHILHGGNFDIGILDDTDISYVKDEALANSSIEDNNIRNITDHAMLITDIDEDGNIILSTWGSKAKLLDGVPGGTFINSISFEIDDTI